MECGEHFYVETVVVKQYSKDCKFTGNDVFRVSPEMLFKDYTLILLIQ